LSSSNIVAATVFQRELHALKLLRIKLERDALNNEDPQEARLSEEASWDYDVLIKYFEGRIKELS
jgi:hypothetical protein